ncbi:MAG: beta-propeller fold lactonase family protein [Phycisphaerales bacterium]
MRLNVIGVAAGLLVTCSAFAQPFQIVATQTPPFNIPPDQWKSVTRWSLTGSGSSFTGLTSLPDGQVHDPIGIAFRTPTDLFISNRAGNGFQPGSISRFTFSNGGATATKIDEFSQTGLVGPHEIAFNPITRELFAGAVNDGIWRWKFDTSGVVTANGSFARGRPWRGVCVEPSGNYLYATAATGTVFRFRLNGDGSVTELSAQNISGASLLHFFSLGPVQGEIYVSDYGSNKVYRLVTNPVDGSFTVKQAIDSTQTIDCTFSPDGNEMYSARHNSGGIDRFTYNSGTDSWTFTSTVSTPSMGSIAAYVPAVCPADLTGEGFVDDSDFVIFVQAYNILDCADGSMPIGCPADFNLDGLVDDSDFVIFVAAYNALVCGA